MEKMSKNDAHILLLYMLKSLNYICEKSNIPYYACAGTCLGAIRHGGFIPWDDDIDVKIPRKYYDIFVEKCNELLEYPLVIRTRENDPTFCCEYIKICFKDDCYGYSDVALDVFFFDETNPNRKVFRSVQNRILRDLYFVKKYKLSKAKMAEHYVPNNPIKRIYVFLLSVFWSFNAIEKYHKKIMLAEKKECDYWVNWGSCYSYKKVTYLKELFGKPQKAPFENTYIYLPEFPEKMLTQLYGADFMTPPPPEKRVDHGVKKLNCKELDFEKVKNIVLSMSYKEV